MMKSDTEPDSGSIAKSSASRSGTPASKAAVGKSLIGTSPVNKPCALIAAMLAALLSIFMCLAIVSPAYADDDDDSGDPGYYITNYSFNGTWHEDNRVSVTETISAYFYLPKHGIIRTIPYRFDVGSGIVDQPGSTISYKSSINNIDTHGTSYEIDDDDPVMGIRLGDEDTLVSGPVSYTISYDYQFPNDRIDSLDFLYYSVLGSSWDVTIDNFVFEMNFEKDLPQDTLDTLQIYSGYGGSEGDALDVQYSAGKNFISGYASNIPDGNAITIFGILPEGYFAQQPGVTPIVAIVFLALACAAAAASIVMSLITRSKADKPVVTVEFYPPSDLSPAEVGTIIDNTADTRDLIALIPWWANKGYLTIERRTTQTGKVLKHDENEIVITQTAPLPNGSRSFERKMFNALFRNGNELVLPTKDKEIGDSILKAKEDLGKSFRGKRKLVLHSGLASLFGLIPVVLFGFAVGFNSEVALFDDFGFSIVTWAIGCVFFGGCFWFLDADKKVGSIIMAAIAAAVMVFIAAVEAGIDGLLPLPVMLAALVVTLAGMAFSPGIRQNSEYRMKYLGKLLGLKQFIKTAELSRLQMLQDENESYYYDVLPYAIAFGLDDKWAEDFESIAVPAPSWYIYDNSTAFAAGMMVGAIGSDITRSIQDAMQQTISDVSSIATSAASSDSGGVSGGGGGGGGGSSW